MNTNNHVSMAVRLHVPKELAEKLNDPSVTPSERVRILTQKKPLTEGVKRNRAQKVIAYRVPDKLLEHVNKQIKKHGGSSAWLKTLIEDDMRAFYE